MDLLQMPVTLVVKAPNQKIADQTVECALDWTIMKLKSHLSSVYPNKPKEHQQRIIYSGKLLQDDVQLKDILRQFDPEQTTHTVHLVCSQPEFNTTKPTASPASHTTEPMTTEGVRHRRVPQHSNHGNTEPTTTSPAPVFTTPQPSEPTPAETNQAFEGAGQFFNPGPMGYPAGMGMMAPGAAMMPGFFYSPEQMMQLQQMYTQQMAQYMQYYRSVPNAPHGADSPEQQAANQNAPLAQAANQQAAPERDAPMVMNAAGDAVVDDDEENGNRDWLDWLYTCSRFVVLLSIVYFYSTISRFVIVIGCFLFLYLYQQGWFQIQREVRNRQDEEVRNNGQNNAENNAAVENDAAAADGNGDVGSPEEADAGTSAEAPEPQPGYVRVAFSFFMTFFTSLIPQNPPPVNIN